MDAQTDAQLLRAYAERRSDAAFAELVRRHIDLVHSAARRMVGDAHLAEDVTQATFLALAKSAAQLTVRAVLAGWLHRTAQNIAAQTVRTDVRRRAREQEAAAMNELLATSPEADWEQIAPHLDAALGELSEPERDAVMLRYFQRQSARDMAQTLGISDEAAQKRVSRAVDRLRELFAKRGVTVGTGGLAVVISANAVQAAPVGLALTIATAAALTATTLVSTATVTATKAIAMTALQKTIVTATIAVLAGAGIYEARQALRLRDQVQTLLQQQAPLVNQVAQLNHALIEATNRLEALLDDNERLNRNTAELLKLRGQAGLLRRQALESANLNRESVFQGQTLGAWLTSLDTLEFLGLEPKTNQPVAEAFQAMGDRAVPFLREELRSGDILRQTRAVKAARVIGPAAKELIPDILTIANLVADSGQDSLNESWALAALGPEAIGPLTSLFTNQNKWTKIRAVSAFREVPYNAEAAIPALLNALSDPETYVRTEAAPALTHLHQQLDIVIPALVKNMKDSDATVRRMTAFAIGELGTDGKPAVPALISLLNDEDASVRSWSGDALKKVDPFAATQAGVK